MDDALEIAELLADQLDRLLGDQVNADFIRKSETEGLDPVFWSLLEDLGVSLLLVPGEKGGAGAGWGDAERVIRLLGYHAAPAPLGETMMAAELLAVAGLDPLPGPIAIVDNRADQDASSVPWAGDATHILTVTGSGDAPRTLSLFARADVTLETDATIGRIPGHRVRFDGKGAVATAAVPASFDIRPRLAVLRSLAMAGAIRRTLELTTEFAATRVQFGKPISGFQAIQHLLAQLAEESAAAEAAAVYGARQVDRGNVEMAAAVAKVRTGMAATRAAAIAHQVFGAIGITSEHQLHYYTRRLWQWRDEAGSEHYWAERLGRAVLAGGGDRLWANVSRY